MINIAFHARFYQSETVREKLACKAVIEYRIMRLLRDAKFTVYNTSVDCCKTITIENAKNPASDKFYKV